MSNRPNCRIEWTVFDNEWKDAKSHNATFGPGALRDDEAQTRLTAIFSAIQIRYDDQLLFPSDALSARHEEALPRRARRTSSADDLIPVFDTFGWVLHPIHLGSYLSWLMTQSGFLDGPDQMILSYRDAESTFYIAFQRFGPDVLIGATWEHSPVLRVPRELFMTGVQHFWRTLLDDVNANAPELLTWPEFALMRVEQRVLTDTTAGF